MPPIVPGRIDRLITKTYFHKNLLDEKEYIVQTTAFFCLLWDKVHNSTYAKNFPDTQECSRFSVRSDTLSKWKTMTPDNKTVIIFVETQRTILRALTMMTAGVTKDHRTFQYKIGLNPIISSMSL